MATIEENKDFEYLLLTLGACAGGIDRGINHDMLVEALATGSLEAAYILGLRDRLTSVLNESGTDLRTLS